MESINRVPLDEKPLLQDYERALPVHVQLPSGPEEEALTRRERRRRSCRKAMRKVHAVVLLGAFYYLVRFVAFPAALKLFSTCYRKSAGSDYAISNFEEFSNNLDEVPSDVKIVACHEWDEHDDTQGKWRDHEELTTFKLPVSSESLFFLSRGWSAGSVKIVPQDNEDDNIIVDVLTKFSHRHLLEHARVCQITREEGKNGVGIFTKYNGDHQHHPRRRRHHIGYEMTIHIPKSFSLDSPLIINSFETDMPLFAHFVENIAEQVHFKNISLKSANTPIYVTSVAAAVASFETINSPIKGLFNTSSSLKLSTSNSPIHVHVGMLNSKDSGDFTTLDMATSNAAVEALISLQSKEETGGKFKVTSHNTVSRLDIAFPTAPVDSTLILDASTSVSSVKVNLHETYEGKILLETSLTRPNLIVATKEDPSGEGRKRVVDARSIGNKIIGSVGWSKEGMEVGEVHVRTSISPLSLHV